MTKAIATETLAATETVNVETPAKAGRPKMQLDLDLIVSAHEGGYTAAEIVDLLAGEGVNVCAATVRTRLREAGATLKRGARRAEIDADEIVALYVEQGMTLADTAHELDISVPTLRAHMKTHGIASRPRGRRKAVKPAEASAEASSEAAEA